MQVIVGILGANIAYIFLLVVMSIFFDLSVADSLTGVFSETENEFVRAVWAIGGLLAILDFLAVLGLIGKAFDSSF